MFLKKKKAETKVEGKVVLGMIMLFGETSFDLDSFVRDYNSCFDDKIQKLSGDNSSSAFKLANEMVSIAHLPFPIPWGDIEGTAEYAYNWQTVLDDTKEHKSHLIVSIIQGGRDQIKRFGIFTQVICSLLRVTNSIGVYQGTQSLLIPKQDYLIEAALMNNEYLPLNLWVYFGLHTSDNGHSGYTYGLKEFNKTEMEILNSSKSLGDIKNFLFNMAHYVLEYDVIFKAGQTCGLSADEKIAIDFSKGKFVEGDTFKLAY